MDTKPRPECFVFGFKIDKDGKADPLPPDVHDGTDKFWVWIGVDPAGPGAEQWLLNEAGLDAQAVASLMTMDARPRCLISGKGALLILRGVNADPKSDPTDLVSIRIWIEDDRVITVQHRQLATIDALRRAYESGNGPETSVQLIVAIGNGMIERLRTLLETFETEMDKLEDTSATGDLRQLRRRLNKVRHDIVPLRRYLAPQRDALVVLMQARLPWVDDWWQSHLRDLSDEVYRFIEQLDAIRESANIVQDTLNSRIAEDTNKMIVLLSMGAAAFLPLNLFVGLLGANVAGIPAAQSPYAFWVVVGILALILAAEYFIFLRLRLRRLLR
jgi:zinc transporter